MTRCVGVRPGRWLRSVWSVAHASGSFHVCLCMLSMSLMVVSANVNASACVSISSLLVSAIRTPVYMTRSSRRVRSGSDEQPKHAVEEARSGRDFCLPHTPVLAQAPIRTCSLLRTRLPSPVFRFVVFLLCGYLLRICTVAPSPRFRIPTQSRNARHGARYILSPPSASRTSRCNPIVINSSANVTKPRHTYCYCRCP